MGRSEFDCSSPRPAWNAGRKVGTKRPLKPRQIWAIRFHLDREHRLRDRALFDLAIDSKLRGCDLVKIKIGDLVTGGKIRTRAIVMQQKTGGPVQFEIVSDARGSLLVWLERRGGSVEDYVLPSRIDHSTHMSTRQYYRLVDEWVSAVGLRSADYGAHSLRRTKASIIFPQPNRPAVFKGIIHLHGVLDEHGAAPDDEAFVLSSADFGRAYLSDGWATRFIRSLMERYQIIFVGYPTGWLTASIPSACDLAGILWPTPFDTHCDGFSV